MIMHVVPVGLSLLRRIAENRLPGARAALDLGILAQRDGGPRPLAEHLRGATDNPGRTLNLRQLVRDSESAALADGAIGLCGEWESVNTISQLRSTLDGGTAYVLLGTDTDDGLRAAVLVAARYIPGRELRYIDDPREGMVIEPHTVNVCRVPGLDLRSSVPECDTWEALGAVGKAAAATAVSAVPDRWDVVLHLSGGYKALIPYLLVMAEGIASVIEYTTGDVGDRRPTLRAVALHEDNPGNVVDLPVRVLSDPLYRAVLDLKKAVDPTGRVPTGNRWDLLLGSAIERDGAVRRLSPLGTILAAVL